jgi:hypothetical protein
MTINKSTMLFEDLTEEEAGELARVSYVINTEKAPQHWKDSIRNIPYMVAWLDDCEIPKEKHMIFASTVFPHRVALSALIYYRERISD